MSVKNSAIKKEKERRKGGREEKLLDDSVEVPEVERLVEHEHHLMDHRGTAS